MKIGIVSDTHGKVHPKIHNVFEDVDQIWHAGDVVSLDVINEWETIAPVTAVRGNTDRFPIVSKYQDYKIIEISHNRFFLTHQYVTDTFKRITHRDWAFDLNFQMIICGHTHIPMIKQFKSVLYFNPGSAVHSRYNAKASVGYLLIENNGSLYSKIIFLS